MNNYRSVLPSFNEKKATQTAGLILAIYGKPIEYEKLVKLIYNINREALRGWGRPVVYDESYSLPEGLILSRTLDLAKENTSEDEGYWRAHINRVGFNVELRDECEDGELSDNEVVLITRVANHYRNIDTFAMRDEHHKNFGEWKDPHLIAGASRIRADLVEILEKLDFAQEDISAIVSEIHEDAHIKAYLSS